MTIGSGALALFGRMKDRAAGMRFPFLSSDRRKINERLVMQSSSADVCVCSRRQSVGEEERIASAVSSRSFGPLFPFFFWKQRPASARMKSGILVRHFSVARSGSEQRKSQKRGGHRQRPEEGGREGETHLVVVPLGARLADGRSFTCFKLDSWNGNWRPARLLRI